MDLVWDGLVIVARPHVLAHALHEVRTSGAAGVDGAVRVCDHDPHRSLSAVRGDLLEVPARAGHGAAGPCAGHEVRDASGSVPPDLRAGGLVVRGRRCGVEELVGLIRPGDLPLQTVGDPVVGVLGLGRDGGLGDHHLGAVGAQHVPLLLTHLVRRDEHGTVALELGHHGQAHAGVAGGRLHHGAAGGQASVRLSLLEHLQGDPVLHGASRVQVLQLDQHGGTDPLGHPVQPHQGGVPDQPEHVLGILHLVLLGSGLGGGCLGCLIRHGPHGTGDPGHGSSPRPQQVTFVRQRGILSAARETIMR